jgi:hypothetical protein
MFLTQIVKSAGEVMAESISTSICFYDFRNSSSVIMTVNVSTRPRFSCISRDSGSLFIIYM